MDLDITALKRQCNVDFDDDDAYLADLLRDAYAHIWRSINRTEEDFGGTIPTDLQRAALMLAAHWYDTRTPVAAASMVEVPYTLTALLRPFRRLV